MKIPKLVKITSAGPIYKVSQPAQINEKMIDSIAWPKGDYYRNFMFSQVTLNPVKPLKFKVSKRYIQMLSCFSPRSGITTMPPPAYMPGIIAREPKNLKELVRLNRLAHTALLKRLGKRANISARKDYALFEKTYLPKAKALLFFKDSRFAGILVHFSRTGLFGDKQDYIAWHDRFIGLSPKEIKAAQYQLALWLKKTTRRRISVFLTPGKNEMYKFFGKLGFVTSRVLFEKVQD